MSSFDTGRGIIILEAAQWDVLERMLTGPAAERATYAEGALAGLEDLGVIDPYGPTEAARGVLAGLVAADARYVLRRLDPAGAVSVRDLVIFLAAPRCTIARHDADGVHIYACDDVEVPHIALANDHLYPWPVIDDGPEEIFDTLASAARLQLRPRRRGRAVDHGDAHAPGPGPGRLHPHRTDADSRRALHALRDHGAARPPHRPRRHSDEHPSAARARHRGLGHDQPLDVGHVLRGACPGPPVRPRPRVATLTGRGHPSGHD